MPRFRVVIDRSLCSGYGLCVRHAAGPIALDGEALAVAKQEKTDDASVLAAADACPMGAIEVYDLTTRRRVA
jgi:ferredoxin